VIHHVEFGRSLSVDFSPVITNACIRATTDAMLSLGNSFFLRADRFAKMRQQICINPNGEYFPFTLWHRTEIKIRSPHHSLAMNEIFSSNTRSIFVGRMQVGSSFSDTANLSHT